MIADLRNALRALRAAPGFTVVALAILTLGIGATTAIFSVVDAVVLRGLPFDEADRLVAVSEGTVSSGQSPGAQAPQNYLDWRAGQRAFEGLAAVTGGTGFILRRGGEGIDIRTRRVTHELFTVLRVTPYVGRAFSADHEVEGRHQVAVLSHAFWQQRFGGDASVVGTTMALDNGTYEILGVMPAGFTYPIGPAEPPEMWVPYVVPAVERTRGNDRGYYLQLVGRLKSGVTIDQAHAQLEGLTAGLAERFPDWFKGRQMSVIPLHEALVGRVRSWMTLLFGAVAFVLLLASVNVANLMLARGLSRSRELGIRAALGASRWHLARALLVESLVLSVVGTSLGLLVAWLGVDLLRSTMPASVPRVSDIAIDLRVLVASAGIAVATGVFFGLLPALQFSRPNLTRALRDGDRSVTAGVAKQRLRSALVAGEVALAVVLLAGSGLFLSSFNRIMAIDLGIDHEHVLTTSVPLGLTRPREMTEAGRAALAEQARAAFEAVLASVQSVPGVEAAAMFSGAMPLTGSSNTTDVIVPSTDREFRGRDSPEIKRVTSDYHVVLGIPLRSGRYFTREDRQDSAPVAIISDVAAARYFDGTSAVGQVVNVSGQDRTVVGVVGAVRQNGPETPTRPEIYVPMSQVAISVGDLVIRTTDTPTAVLPDVRRALLNVLPNAVLPSPRTMNQLLGTLVAQRRFNMLLFSLFGVLGLVIALVGIYGVMAYIVEQRTVEFGVRMALGAPRGSILRSVLSRAAIYLGVGLGVGLIAAIGLSRFVASFLFDITPGNPTVYGLVAGLLTLTGVLAALVPAWRASRVDPVAALRA